MRKLITIILSITILFSVAIFSVACGNDNETRPETPLRERGTSQPQNNNDDREADPTPPPTQPDSDFTSVDDFEYELDGATRGVFITAYTGNSFDVRVPEEIDGHPVTGIMRLSSAVVNVYLPDTVLIIGDGAFENSSLENITLSENLLEIRNRAFAGSQITNMVIPDSVTILGEGVFQQTPLISLVIGNGITNISGDIISPSDTLTDVVIGNSVETIPRNLFRSCSALTNVTLGNNVTIIESEAFVNTESLMTIILPDNLKIIHSHTFVNSGLTSIIIPDNVEYIGYIAFSNNIELREVYISELSLLHGEMSSKEYNELLIDAEISHTPAAVEGTTHSRIDSEAFTNTPALSEESRQRILVINPMSRFN